MPPISRWSPGTFGFNWIVNNHSLYCNGLNDACFRFVINLVLERSWFEMQSWSSRISGTDHDRKLRIRLENRCWLFTCYVLFTILFVNILCSAMFPTTLGFQMSNWVIMREVMVGNAKLVDSNFTSNRDWKLEIQFEKGCLHPQGFDFIRYLTV